MFAVCVHMTQLKSPCWQEVMCQVDHAFPVINDVGENFEKFYTLNVNFLSGCCYADIASARRHDQRLNSLQVLISTLFRC